MVPAPFAEQRSSFIDVTCRSVCYVNFPFLCSHCVLNEQATDGCAIINEELSTAVDLFLMSFPIMQTITAIRSYPRQPAAELACAARFVLSAA